ncbi:MAG TPA: CHAT domain-containing protein [Ktedonobacterales bacterium]
MEYLNFDVEINPERSGLYPVAARSRAGDARHLLRFPFDEQTLETDLLRLQNALLRSARVYRGAQSPEEHVVQQFGQRLFEALFAGDVRRLYDASAAHAAEHGQGLRLRLRIGAPELAALPWEFLYDPLQREYMCFLPDTVIVRYLEVAQPIPPFHIEPPLRVLAMIADPSDQARLNVLDEKQRLLNALAPLEQLGILKLRWVEGQRVHDLHQALLQRDWHIFHFIGHGAFDPNQQEGVLALANEQGKTRLLSATALARLLAQRPSLRLVVLNSCQGAAGSRHDIFSSTAATLASKRIPAVLAMQYEISDQAAIDFTRGFYNSLAVGLPVDSAVTQARTAISVGTARTLEWVTPVLYLRASTGVLFEVPPPATSVRLPAPLQPLRLTEDPPSAGYFPSAPGVSPTLPAYPAFSSPQAGSVPVGASPAYVPGNSALPSQGMPIPTSYSPLPTKPAGQVLPTPSPGFGGHPPYPVPFAPPTQPQSEPSQRGPSVPAFQRLPQRKPVLSGRVLLFSLIGAIVAAGLMLALVMAAINPNTSISNTPPTATTTATPRGATHISNVLIGRGDNRGNITTQTTTFTLADTIDIDYIGTTQDSNAVGLLRLLRSNGSLAATIGPLTLQQGTHSYYYTFVMKETGGFTAQLQYNSTTEETLQFTVK